jgi:MSHA biogenesis protein MshQ
MPSLVSNGNGTMIYEAGADEFVYTRDANARIAPFNAELEMELTGIVDSDGVAMPASELPALQSTGTSIRYGRLVLENAYGPETMDLRVPFEVQIWNGTRFERHADENCWVYSTADAVITDTPPNTVVDGATGMLAGGAPQSGSEIVLSAPGEGNTGSIRVRYPVPGYWQDDFDGNGSKEDPTAIATFGVYRGNDRVIYWGER